MLIESPEPKSPSEAAKVHATTQDYYGWKSHFIQSNKLVNDSILFLISSNK